MLIKVPLQHSSRRKNVYTDPASQPFPFWIVSLEYTRTHLKLPKEGAADQPWPDYIMVEMQVTRDWSLRPLSHIHYSLSFDTIALYNLLVIFRLPI